MKQRLCATRLRRHWYPCVLRRLDGFEDVSYGNDENDSVRFRIGGRWYWLFVGETEEQRRERVAERAADGGETLREHLGLHEEATDDEVDILLGAEADFPRYSLASADDEDDAYNAAPEFETESTAALLEHLGELMVSGRRQALAMRKNRCNARWG